MSERPAERTGQVFLVGAGPGDPGLITLRGLQCLKQADVVLYDHLANPQLLQYVAPHAELISLGRHRRGRIMPQSEVNQRMIRHALDGKKVVRLKGGDPAVFARSAEEINALRSANIPFEIVPGITAALAAGSHAGIALTDRDRSSAVALVTGHEQDEKANSAIDYGALANFPGTLVFYMGVTSAPMWTRALILRGKPADTPVAIIRRCSWPDQLTVHCTLGTAAEELAKRKMRPPVIVVVGDVAAPQAEASWYIARPMFGTRVLVTRPISQAIAFRDRLHELGADVLVQPAIEIGDPPDWAPVDAALEKLPQYDWLVFSSANGVAYLLERLCAVHGDLRRLGNTRLAAIGPATADELARYHLKADLVPERFRAESLAQSLIDGGAKGRFLLARASRGREVLAEQLRCSGARVDQVVVYRSADVEVADAEVARTLAEGNVDWITVTSSAIARSLAGLFGEDLRRAKLASISPITSATLRKLGYEPAVEATEYTMDGVVDAILRGSK